MKQLKKTKPYSKTKRAFTNLFAGSLLCAAFTSAGFGQNSTIWIRPNHIPFQEFKADIKAFGPPHISYAESLLAKERKRADSFHLKKRLIPAQELYLSGEGREAEKIFKEISSLSFSADWGDEDRRIILYSFLRQAQSEKDREKRKAILLSAGDFTLSALSPSNYRDWDLFPPPLMKELQLIQSQARALQPDWNKIFPKHELIVVNGEVLPKNMATKLPSALYRVSAFSSSHQPYSATIRLSTLLSKRITGKRLTSGFCKNLTTKLPNVGILPFPPSSCPVSSVLQALKTKNQTKPETPRPRSQEANPSAFIKTSLLGSGTAETQKEATDPQRTDKPPLLYSEEFLQASKQAPFQKAPSWREYPAWIAVGAGIVIMTVALLSNEKKERESAPQVKAPESPPQGKHVY